MVVEFWKIGFGLGFELATESPVDGEALFEVGADELERVFVP